MASRIPELLDEIRRRSRKQGVEYVGMNDYLTDLKLPPFDMARVLRSILEKNWIAAEPDYSQLAQFGWDYRRFPSLKLALLPDGLIFLEEREREHAMMADARGAKRGATVSWIIAAAAAAIAACTWLFPRGGNEPTVKILPVLYMPPGTGNAATDTTPKPKPRAATVPMSDSMSVDSARR